MADAKFDVCDGAFQDEFAELTEPHLTPNDLTVFALQRKKGVFGVQALVLDRVILQEIVADAVSAEFAVLDHWGDDFSP